MMYLHRFLKEKGEKVKPARQATLAEKVMAKMAKRATVAMCDVRSKVVLTPRLLVKKHGITYIGGSTIPSGCQDRRRRILHS
jgi:hypothetical protein